MEEVEAAHEEALDDIRLHAERRISPYSGQPTPLEGRDTTFAELVAVLSRCVRQAILLEARLAAGAYDRPAPQDHPSRQHPAHPATQAAPASLSIDRLRFEQIEDDSFNADATRSAPDILAGICAELGAAIDTGLVLKNRSNPDTPTRAAPHLDRPLRPPPPLSQAERSKRAFLQQQNNAAGHPHKPP